MTVEMSQEVGLELIPYEEAKDDGEHYAHIVDLFNNRHLRSPGMSAQDLVDLARMTQTEITAICGYVWVPKLNPAKHDVCKSCVDIMKNME